MAPLLTEFSLDEIYVGALEKVGIPSGYTFRGLSYYSFRNRTKCGER